MYLIIKMHKFGTVAGKGRTQTAKKRCTVLIALVETLNVLFYSTLNQFSEYYYTYAGYLDENLKQIMGRMRRLAKTI